MLDIDEIPHPNEDGNTVASGFAGLMGGLAGLAVGHPFDTVKVRLQTPEISSRYKGTWNCFVSTVRQEKIFGLYKGVTSPAAGVALVNALVFGSYEYILSKLQTNATEQQPPDLTHIMIAGMGAGVVTSAVTCPMELAKVQLQNQIHSGTTRGPLHCLQKMYMSGGIKRCFGGMTPTVLRELSFGPYFVAYECATRYLATTPVVDLNSGKVIVAGGIAGIAAWCSTYPADVVKTRMQADPQKYRHTLDCFRECFRLEGLRGLYRGLTPTLLRAFPSNAATFMAYTWTIEALTSKQQHSKPSKQRDAVII